MLLPVELNQKLRGVIVAAGGGQVSPAPGQPRTDEETLAMFLIQQVENAHVPEVRGEGPTSEVGGVVYNST